MNKQNKNGITLIALIITIIVMLILLGVTVTGAINGGLIGTSQEAKYKTEISQIKEALEEEIINRKALKESTDNITIADLEISNKLKEKYQNKLEITNGEIYYIPYEIENGEETKWLEDMNIMANTIFFEYNGAIITGFSQKGYEAIAKGTTKFVMPTKSNNGTEITTIDKDAFNATLEGKEACAKITRFIFPDTLQIINTNLDTNTGAFTGCIGLKELDLTNTKLTKINNCTFQNCSGLTEVKLPNNLTNISYRAFQDCSSLKRVHFPNSLTEIGYQSFKNCSSLEEINLTNTQIKSIGYEAFSYCVNLKKAEIPETLTSIASFGFWHCEKMESISLGRVTSITPYCFQYCISLKNIELPDSVVSIRERAFHGCSKLEKVVIPSSVTAIVWEAFTSLTSECEVYVPFTEEEGKPEGWHDRWIYGGKIIYADPVTE